MEKTKILPVDVWKADGHKWPSRFVSNEVLEALSKTEEEQISTDNHIYPDVTTARQVADIYRRKFRKANPGRRLQIRILPQLDGWQLFFRTTN